MTLSGKVYKINYDDLMNKELAVFGKRPKILLHSCCGPCSTTCLERLTPIADVTVFFYNPNITPVREYLMRLDAQQTVCDRFGVPLIEGDYDGNEWADIVDPLRNQPEGGARCNMCFFLRLAATAQEARKRGFDYFTTTLTVSPHKDVVAVNGAGLAAERALDTKNLVPRDKKPSRSKIAADGEILTAPKFLPADFSKHNGYARSVELSKELGLYRQNYCGCDL